MKTAKVATVTLLMFALGAAAAVLVAGAASAASPTTTTKKTTGKTDTTGTSTTDDSPWAHFFVVNGTANAASDHEILGSSAFPNYATGAVDNYYPLSHAHLDNSPSAEGRASPFDTGPVGQTAAAGNFQQPQYADARYPGNTDKATYGSQGGPYATANASEFKANADASLAQVGLAGTPTATKIAAPKALDGRVRLALAGWKAKWGPRLGLTKPPAPAAPPKIAPKLPVTPPSVTIPTPVATVTTPQLNLPTPPLPTPTVPKPTVPTPTLPSGNASAPSRSLAASTTSTDGAFLLVSSTETSLDPKTKVLTTSGETSLGRVSLAGGQIVIEGIHVTASIKNDGTPTNKVAISIGSATIGGVPVTIDQDGVHVAGQGQALPYQQASDALNSALKQAGIQLFLVQPEINTNTCDQSGSGSGGGTSTDTTQTATSSTSTDQSSMAPPSSCGSPTCDQSSMGSGTGTTDTGTSATPATPLPSTSTDQTSTTSSSDSCAPTCDQSSTGTTGTGTNSTTTSALPTSTGRTSTTQTSTNQTDTTSTTSSCDYSSFSGSSGMCEKASPAGGTTTGGNDQMGTTGTTGTTTMPGAGDQYNFGIGGGGAGGGAGEVTVRATGLHVLFTQPVNQGGVPAQYAEHILGEVFLDSLAVPAPPVSDLGLDTSSTSSYSSSSPSSGSGACLGANTTRRSTSGGGGLTAGGSGSSSSGSAAGSLSPSASGYSSSSQPAGSSTGTSLPAAFAQALRKPLWLLVAYLVWQTLVIGTGVSLWNWRRGGAS